MASATKTPKGCACVVGVATNLTASPYNSRMPLLLRRRDVLDRLGITTKQLDKLISTGLIKPVRKRGCRSWFRARDLETI